MTDLQVHDVPADVDRDEWRLDVTGAVARDLALDRSDLAAFEPETFTEDFECVDGWVAADLTWRGVRVGDVLAEAAPDTDSSHALVAAMDGEYACSFPLERLSEAVLAVGLDGDPLPVEHGGPARLVPIDDADCWESVKWVTALRVTQTAPANQDTAERIARSRIE
jgi:DMSO/TMAO reductase YedYZ molybdopterin-dependent catalytic subunit